MARNRIKIVQWNARSIKNKIPELQYNCKAYDIILLIETWLNRKDTLYLKDFDEIRKDRAYRRGGGVAIAVSKRLRYRAQDNLFDCHGLVEIAAIEIFTADGPLTMASCYKPLMNNPIARHEWNKLLAQFEGPLVLGGGGLQCPQYSLGRQDRLSGWAGDRPEC
jgi:hypothetical protein